MTQKISPYEEIIREVAKDAGITPEASRQALKTFLKSIMRLAVEGKIVRFVGFGSFMAKKYQSTIGRNPRTGEKIEIPAMMRARFTPGKDFREAVNPKKVKIKVLKEHSKASPSTASKTSSSKSKVDSSKKPAKKK